MTNKPPQDDMRTIWQQQPVDTLEMTMSEIREKAARFEKKISRRNLREYIAAALVVAGFSAYLVIFPNTIVRIGCLLVIAGTLFVVRQLHSKGGAQGLPSGEAFASCVDFYRAELVRQRDLLRGVWLWYIAPLVPGFIVFQWGISDMRPDRAQGSWLSVVAMAVVFLAVVGLNWWGARKLQSQIDELDGLRTGD